MKRQYFNIIIAAMAAATACSTGGERAENERTAIAVGDADKVQEVTVMELHPSTFSHEIVGNGRAAARRKADLSFSAGGMVDEVLVRNGQRVAKGQPLVRLDRFQLENELAKAREAVESARLEMQDVIIGQGYDPEQMAQVPTEVVKLARQRSNLEANELALAAAERNLQDATLVAPMGGVVANMAARPHSVAPQPVCTLIDDSAMDVEFEVLESELPMVRPGDAVEVAPFSSPTRSRGTVTELNPMVDANGMVKVRATVGGNHTMIDGMNVRVTIGRAVEQALVVPKSAVVLRSGRQVVFTLDDGKAMWHYVATGLENLSQYTITEGLEPGMMVITSGNINLAHESPVKVME